MRLKEAVGLPAVLGGVPVRTRAFPSWPQAGEREVELLRRVLDGHRWFAGARGDDPEALGTLFAARFAALHQSRHSFAVANGSVAIEIALAALGIGAGDEVIVPSYTFVSTATSVLRVGAVPVFADIDPKTYCLDPADVARKLTARTRAVLPVHLGGQMADMVGLTALAALHGLHVVEDCAQAIGSRWHGRMAGTWGAIGTFSFQSNKTITAGEGGLVLTDDPELAEEISALRAFGRYKGETAERSSAVKSRRLSTNFRLSELQSAVLLAQLERFPEHDERRQANAAYLTGLLEQIPGVEHVRHDAPDSRHGYYYYLVRFEPELFAGMTPTTVARALSAEGVPFIAGDTDPIYRHPVFRAEELTRDVHPEQLEHFRQVFDRDQPGCPEAEDACRRTLILRHPVLLADRGDMDDVAEAVNRVQSHSAAIATRASLGGLI
jgi:dTDP-4-amino-4,6-dideoxygalactose transaminase